jgi:hypothetical protein
VLRAARLAPATVVAHLERSAPDFSIRESKIVFAKKHDGGVECFQSSKVLAGCFSRRLRGPGRRKMQKVELEIRSRRQSVEHVSEVGRVSLPVGDLCVARFRSFPFQGLLSRVSLR